MYFPKFILSPRFKTILAVTALTAGTLVGPGLFRHGISGAKEYGESGILASAQAEEAQKIQTLTIKPGLPGKVDLQLSGPQGRMLVLPLQNGHPYLLHVWATWCPPCREELPRLSAFLKQHPDAPVVPLAIQSGSADKVAAFLEKLDLKDFPAWIADKQKVKVLLDQLPEPGLPVTLLIDGQGQIRAASDGDVDWAAHDAETQMKALLARVGEPVSGHSSPVKSIPSGKTGP